GPGDRPGDPGAGVRPRGSPAPERGGVMLPERHGSQRRIGVAIQVPEPFSTQLQEARVRSGDPLARAIPPHITLLGPTVVEPDELGTVVDHLAKVAGRHEPFPVLLRGTGTFRPVSPVVFVQVAAGISECEQL